tara:strand:- start:463 stop:576 length:114 start_codon:yes stop_codon:yes gene_type:complete
LLLAKIANDDDDDDDDGEGSGNGNDVNGVDNDDEGRI